MIPSAVLDSLAYSCSSQQMCAAAADLTVRINEGEYDNLDDAQLNDLQDLAVMLRSWAARVQTFEQLSDMPLRAMPIQPRTGA